MTIIKKQLGEGNGIAAGTRVLSVEKSREVQDGAAADTPINH